MQITCREDAILHSFSPMISPILPPIFASISSNTRTGVLSTFANWCFSASIIRDISPPDAIFLNGFKSSPGFGEIRNPPGQSHELFEERTSKSPSLFKEGVLFARKTARAAYRGRVTHH